MFILIILILSSNLIQTRADMQSRFRNIINKNTYEMEANIDDIFNLLSSEPSKFDNSLRVVDKKIYDKPFFENVQDKQSTFKRYLNTVSSLAYYNLIDSETIKDIAETVGKVSKIYDRQKEKIKTYLYSNKLFNNFKNHPKPDGVITSAVKAIGSILQPSNIETVLDATRKAKEEGEILESITSVILGTEGRGGYGHGSGLTLDPVTCIALVTLAAYLIRAVFQILTLTTTGKRSINELNYLLEDSDVPGLLNRVYGAISEDLPYDSLRNEIPEEGINEKENVIKVPGEMALIVKLLIDGNVSCLKRFICIHLTGKSFWHFGYSEMLWSSIGLIKYNSPSKLLKMITSNKDENCQTFTEVESEFVSSIYDTCPDFSINEYLRVQTFVHKLSEEFLRRQKYI